MTRQGAQSWDAADAVLQRRFALGEVEELTRRHRGALDDNPQGQQLLAVAIERAVDIGFEAWCDIHGQPGRELEPGDETWSRWQAQRRFAPEAASWPEWLAEEGGAAGSEALEAAAQTLLAVGEELGMTGAIGGRAETRTLRRAGEQAAEAGAALRRSLDGDDPVEVPDALPATAPEPAPAPLWGDTVRVATVANIAECELLQGMLANAGIPSTWRRSGGDLPDFLAGGYRDVHVPLSAADDARSVLAEVERSQADEPDAPATRRVGLERTPLRLLGKGTAIIALTGGSFALAAAALLEAPWTIVACIGFTLFVVAVVAWSEYSAKAQGPS